MIQEQRRFRRDSFIGKGRHLAIYRRPLASVPLHAHDYFEIEIILEGKGAQLLNGKQDSLERGCLSILNPADFHQVEAGEAPSDSWNIAFDETIIPSEYLTALYSCQEPYRRLSEELLQKADAAAKLLQMEADNERSARPLLEYLLSLLLTPKEEKAPLSPMEKALLYIENHFREDPTLGEIAAQVCLSPGYFGALFKRTTGETYIQYLNTRKVHCAKMLLKGGMKVADACFASGFGSLSGFLHTFKKFNGISPEEYKNMHL